MDNNEARRQTAEASAKSGPAIIEQHAAHAGVAEVLQLLAYCARVQAGFPATPLQSRAWISNSSHTIG